MDSPPLVVRTTNLTKQYEDNTALESVELEIPAGEVYGLIGPNGAGKTTLIRLLALADEPTDGEIYICGQQMQMDRPNPEIKRQIGFLPDDFPLYDDLSVRDYLDYFGRLYYLSPPALVDRIGEVLALVQLEGKRDSPIGSLSRGMRQRLSLARAIVHRPTFVLLDEPVSGLDPVARIQYRETIKTLQQQGMTILISSHILSDLEDFCTAIGIMERGRLLESSPLQALYQRASDRRLAIATLDNLPGLQVALQDSEWVSDCRLDAENNRIYCRFSGTDNDAATLLRSLVEAGFAISEFHPTREKLEDIFLKLNIRQTA